MSGLESLNLLTLFTYLCAQGIEPRDSRMLGKWSPTEL